MAAVILTTVTSTACSTPVAVGSLIAGGGALIGAKAMYKDCDGEGCVYGNLLAVMVGVIGFGLVVGGGIGLAVDTREK